MVQYKRKPVKTVSPPLFLDDNSEVWVIDATGEIFVDYERYLNRRDFYLQRIFTCEATGEGNYTFFEALESEIEAAKEVPCDFPEYMRERVLKFVQFESTPRMDDLVNLVFDYFREHLMVGDQVCLEVDNDRRYGRILQMVDSSRLHGIYTPVDMDEQIRSYQYTIKMEDNGEDLIRYRTAELQRDRRVYSKILLKQFLRGALSRESWTGAPWMVKDYLAKRYKIPTKIPDMKTREALMAAKKAHNATNNGAPHPGRPGMGPPYMDGPGSVMRGPHQAIADLLNLKNLQMVGATPYKYMAAPPYAYSHQHPPFINGGQPPPYLNASQPPVLGHPHQQPHPHPHPHSYQGGQPPAHMHAHYPHQQPLPSPGLQLTLPFPNNFMSYQALPTQPTTNAQPQQMQHTQHAQHPQQPPQAYAPAPPAKVVEIVKYPIEDLRFKGPQIKVIRPALKFYSDDVPDGAEPPPDKEKTGIHMKSIGPMLCIWDTLNVHDEIYHLDSFTLDDFAEAIGFSSEETECELLTEMHCAVLKQYLDEDGHIQVDLPLVKDEESDSEESSEESTPEPEPPVRTTRSSLRKSEANQILKQRTPTPEPPKPIHNAAQFLSESEFDWIEQIKTRNFREGGWQATLVGLLYRLSSSPIYKDTCDEVLAQLVPPDEEASIETIAYNYVYLDVNYRISALDIIMRLTVSTEPFREHLAIASQDLTKLRKDKIEHQRKRKELADEVFKLDIERKIQLPLNTPTSPSGTNKENPDVSMAGTEDTKQDADNQESAEEVQTGNRRPRKAVRQTKRKRESEAAKVEKEKKKKAEAAKTKQQKEWEKLNKAIEAKKAELRQTEADIQEVDDDLRETHIHRSKILGKDRFFNKYYWFESNGMPFGGVPTSSTAQLGYANGRIWVQGPDELELQPHLEEEAMAQDKAEFGWTVPERKEKEEGGAHLKSPSEWGYLDDPADLGQLISWLDERGVRERALRKSLYIYRDKIVEYMEIMKGRTQKTEQHQDDEEEDKPRVSTRKKATKEPDETHKRCLLWTNSIMREAEGHNHSEEYQEPKKTRKATTKKGKGKK
ncbi:unnamed protein product [Periconia digitata]|uniref:Uncharacterized protein n=1 Tax=Periconia digitata TaxID=1303443 RepID=A0A9W4XQT5_9PLEO|nr:unnamed protein product [Periconia digitata]